MRAITSKLIAIFTIVASIGFVGCEEQKELFDVKIPFEIPYEGSLSLTLPTTGFTAPFNISDSISIAGIEEIKDYTDRLKALNFKGIEFHVSNFQGNSDASIEGNLNMGGSFGTAQAPFGPSNLKATSDSALPIIVEFDAAEQADISAALLAFEKLNLSFAGEGSNPPVSFDYKLLFKFEVVANPLDQL